MIAGKGHEQGQEFEAGRKIPFDDVTVAREVLRVAVGTAAAAPMKDWTAEQVAAGGRRDADRPPARGPAPAPSG